MSCFSNLNYWRRIYNILLKTSDTDLMIFVWCSRDNERGKSDKRDER